MQRESPSFINFTKQFLMNSKTTTKTSHTKTKIKCLRIPILCLLYELVNCIEIKSFNYIFNLNQKVLDYLISLINSEKIKNENDDELKHIKIISKHILLSGIDVFFTTFEPRKQCLMLMLDLNSPDGNGNKTIIVEPKTNFNVYLGNIANKKSSNLLFEAFCHLFYKAKASLLID
jgi:hypothetical protein